MKKYHQYNKLKTIHNIDLKNDKDTVAKWCKRVDQSRSGCFKQIFVRPYPSSNVYKSIAFNCEYCVQPIPKIKKLKHQQKKTVDMKELARKQKVRQKYNL